MSVYRWRTLDFPDDMRCLVRYGEQPPYSFRLEVRSFGIMSPYTALSYTWGDSKPSCNIKVEGSNLQVSQSLFDFVNLYSPPRYSIKPEIYLWIDQICINQRDTPERNRQVSMMNCIYKMAVRVLVWLGCDPKIVEAARQIRDNDIQDARTVATILRHPYFTRVWIVQEIALAQNVDVLCGSVTLKLSDLQIAATWMGNPPDWGISPAALSLLHEYNAFRSARSASVARGHLGTRFETRTLQHYIAKYCLNNCTDPRDKVYGLLGMTPERWRVDLSYSKAVSDVFLDTMVALCEELFDRLDPKCFYDTTLDRRSGQVLYTQTILTLASAMGIPKYQTQSLEPFLHKLLDVYLDTPKRMVLYTYRGPLPDIIVPSLREANEDLLNPILNPVEPETSRVYKAKADEDLLNPIFDTVEPKTSRIRKAKAVSWSDTLRSAFESHFSTTVVRRNPVLRDVISDLGLQLAHEETQDALHEPTYFGSFEAMRQMLWAPATSSMVADTDRWWFKHNGERYYFNCNDR